MTSPAPLARPADEAGAPGHGADAAAERPGGDGAAVARRAVITGALTLAGGATLAACGSSSSGASAGSSSSASSSSSSSSSSTPAGSSSSTGSSSAAGAPVIVKLSDVPVGSAVSAKLEGKQIIVAQPTKGKVVAFSAICTHAGCPVKPAGKQLNCPCHGSVFDATTGKNLSGPAPSPLPPVAVKLNPAGDGVVAG